MNSSKAAYIKGDVSLIIFLPSVQYKWLRNRTLERTRGKCQDYTEAAAPRQIMDIQQVAKRAKVSTATVSRVLNGATNVREKTSEHVRRVIAELNYVPNTHAR